MQSASSFLVLSIIRSRSGEPAPKNSTIGFANGQFGPGSSTIGFGGKLAPKNSTVGFANGQFGRR
jgi:hypothetical protein